MAITRTPLSVHATVKPYGDRWAVETFYSGCESGVRFCFLDCDDLEQTLACAVQHDGLPALAASVAFGAALEFLGSYSTDDLRPDVEPQVRGARHGVPTAGPGWGFLCWETRASRLVEWFAESVWVLACLGFVLLFLVGAWL